MMYDPKLFIESIHEKQRNINRKAELARLIQEGRETQPPLAERMRLAVADALVPTGEHSSEEAPAPAPR